MSLRRPAKRHKSKTKFPRTIMLSDPVYEALNLRAVEKMGISISSWLESQLRVSLKSELLEQANTLEPQPKAQKEI